MKRSFSFIGYLPLYATVIVLVTSILIMNSSPLIGQATAFYTIVTENPATFDSTQTARWDILQGDTTYSRLDFIDLADTRNLSAFNGVFRVPFSGDSVEYETYHIGGESATQYLWAGY